MGETPLAMAQRHVVEGRRIVERQRSRVLDQQHKGWDTTASESLLKAFERTLAGFEDDLARLSKRSVGVASRTSR